MCSMVAKFWWKPNSRSRGMHWKNWKQLTRNKKEEGMNFKEFTIMNSALLSKQAWRAHYHPQALWVQELIDHQSGEWNSDCLRQHFPLNQIPTILQTPIARQHPQDSLIWPHTSSGDYTVKSGYFRLKEGSLDPLPKVSTSTPFSKALWMQIWNLKVP
ncbi:hypothetical protein SESBI_10764 [Sesbania bispinosa]|nr:hypothetical protein SESBI_10764 [Sesbania bispinosa]